MSTLSEEFAKEIEVIESIHGAENIHFDKNSKILTVKCNVNFQPATFKIVNAFDSQSSVPDSPYVNDVYEQDVNFLPPVLLVCKPSKNYPSVENLASINVKSVWLSKRELLLIEHHLESLWCGSPVIFNLISWLQDEMLEYLDIYDQIHISDKEEEYCCDILSRVSIIDKHNREMFFKNFESQSYECSTCFCDFLGSDMTLLQCLHVYCKDCMASFISVQYSNGKFCAMNCPVCDTFIGRDIVKKFLDITQFNDWEIKFEMQSIEYNSLILVCPRCNGYAVQEDSNLGECESCSFRFCSRCIRAWHPGECENFLEYQTVYNNQKKKLCSQNEKKKEDKRQSMLSELMIRAFMVQCPKCKCWVMRMYGCNHMCCILCMTDFCYVCGRSSKQHGGFYCDSDLPNVPADINVLSKEQESLVDKMKNRRYVQPLGNIIFEGIPDEKSKCVGCKAVIQRIDLNNHAKCAICKVQFCFLCRVVIKGTNHFNSVGCQQHGGMIKK